MDKQKEQIQWRVIPQSDPKCSACIIFLHGAGNTADGLIHLLQKAWGHQDISFPHIQMVFPVAPSRPYTLLNGEESTVWFDQHKMCPTAPELECMDQMCHVLSDLIKEEINKGIPKNRIIIGGYSMGGAMAMTLAYKYHRDIAGVFAFSSFLGHHSSVYKTLKGVSNGEEFPPLFLYHGSEDDIVDIKWAKDTYETLGENGVKGEFHIADIEHEIVREELCLWRDWVVKQLPESP